MKQSLAQSIRDYCEELAKRVVPSDLNAEGAELRCAGELQDILRQHGKKIR